MGWGQVQGATLEERGLKYGDGNIGMQDEHARAVGKHAAAGAYGPPAPAEPLAPHVHGCWCHWSLGQVPARGLPQHLQAPWTASTCPVKSHTSPGRVSICSPEPPRAKGTAPPVPGGLLEQAGVLVLLEVTGLAYTLTAGPEPVVRGTVELQS